MVNHSDAEVSASDSKSPSASSDYRFEVNGILGYGEIQDTEPIDDDDSSLLELPFRKLYDDTELVDDGDCGDEETLDQEFGGLEQVVDDSEDDEYGGTGSVASAKPTCLLERSLKAADTLLESDGSNDHECQTGKQESNCPGLDYLDSQEPGESTQAEALGFVDQLLMGTDLNLSPVNLPETGLRRKSPPFSGAKGRQSLAKRIKTMSPTKKMSVFDWDSDQCDVSGPQNSPVICANITRFKKREDHIKDDNEVKKGSMDPCENRKVPTHPTEISMKTKSAKHHKMEQASGLSQGIMLISHMDGQLQDKASTEQSEPLEDCTDVGISTQIAAEAMSALLYAPCTKDFPRPFLPKEITRLGGSGKVGDFMWKDLRRRRNLAHVRVLFSQNLDDETIKQQKKIMVRLGISPASSSADSTHFIAERFSRTRNMLEAIALGKPVVTPLWLESCGQTRCLIDEKNYILSDSKKEKDGFCMLTSLARAKKHPLLKGLKVCITPNIKPDGGMIADLVKLTQGQVVEISEIIVAADRQFPVDLLILSCEDDRDLCLPFINQGAEIYTSELLLNGIVIQKLEYARHCLF